MKPVALITGAARGIGLAAVDELARQGYRIVAFDAPGTTRSVPHPATRDELYSIAAGREEQVLPFVGDVRRPDDLRGAVDLAVTQFGRLDVAVAAASVIAGGGPMWSQDPDDLDEVWSVDAVGVWNTARVVLPAMLSGPDPRRARFVAVASAAAHDGFYGLSAYCMAKHAVVGLVAGLAADLGDTGPTACAISPGSTDTPMLAATADLYGVSQADLLERQPTGVLAPDEIAEAIAFACSSAGRMLNGSVMRCTGGLRP